MTILYVIGNGFDRHHDLPTEYSHFYNFAKEMLDEIEEYYSFDLSQVKPWHDFENALGAFDRSLFYDSYNNLDVEVESFSTSSAYGLTDELNEKTDNYVEEIKGRFQEWISGIDISIAEKKLALIDNAQFITFNYTSTLQSTYGIDPDRILHIHGRAETYDDLIFGHGVTMEEKPELDENGDSNRTMFSDAEGAAQYPLYALKKPVDEVLNTHEDFFSSLDSVVTRY